MQTDTVIYSGSVTKLLFALLHPSSWRFEKKIGEEGMCSGYIRWMNEKKVAKLYQKPEQSLIPPSREVNIDNTTDKSLSMASEQPVTRPKAPTDLKTKNKKISSSSQPKYPHKVRVILQKKQVAETQHAEVTVATADAIKSLEAFELANERGNQPSTADTKKVIVFKYKRRCKQPLSNFSRRKWGS
nr:hypothetical protein [Tanacetum cinerariifolium]